MLVFTKILFISICSAGLIAVEIDNTTIKDSDLSVGGWQLTSEWEGYMGVSIKFNLDGSFNYWFFSDASFGDVPIYPISGEWKLDGNKVVLNSAERLYSSSYNVVKVNGITCLMPESNYQDWVNKTGNKVDFSRMHFQNKDFLSTSPHNGRGSYKKQFKIEDAEGASE